ncbi:hypothetical protein PT974_02865 [Cladobotryum mycophilum]|uniref:Uncharacterized protein n=1 Tax=Cladobotryum mycophilum TaxID=491253 RepID=A0ABR0SI26_9HYPO
MVCLETDSSVVPSSLLSTLDDSISTTTTSPTPTSPTPISISSPPVTPTTSRPPNTNASFPATPASTSQETQDKYQSSDNNTSSDDSDTSSTDEDEYLFDTENGRKRKRRLLASPLALPNKYCRTHVLLSDMIIQAVRRMANILYGMSLVLQDCIEYFNQTFHTIQLPIGVLKSTIHTAQITIKTILSVTNTSYSTPPLQFIDYSLQAMICSIELANSALKNPDLQSLQLEISTSQMSTKTTINIPQKTNRLLNIAMEASKLLIDDLYKKHDS